MDIDGFCRSFLYLLSCFRNSLVQESLCELDIAMSSCSRTAKKWKQVVRATVRGMLQPIHVLIILSYQVKYLLSSYLDGFVIVLDFVDLVIR